ncbi:MAG TPA: hypothetical protein VIJ22_12730 [Polyangiaceae bacterium]
MQKRLVTAAEWVGKARRDADRAKAFVQVVFALEALLQIQDRKMPVQPSVTYRLTETAAYIRGTDLTSRTQIASDINEI